MLLDVHSHHSVPDFMAIVSYEPADFNPIPGQFYSVGIHPWSTLENPSEEVWNTLESIALRDDVLIIGESGIDAVKGGPMFRQMLVLKRQAQLAERVGKPLLLHDVKGHEQIIGLHREMKPDLPWIIHGFRGKPSVAEMLLKEGFFLSYGEKFNPESLKITPTDRLLTETDDSPLSIREIISNIESVIQIPELELKISANIQSLFPDFRLV